MTPTKTRPHKPMLAEWTSEILSLSLHGHIQTLSCISPSPLKLNRCCADPCTPPPVTVSCLESFKCSDRQLYFAAKNRISQLWLPVDFQTPSISKM